MREKRKDSVEKVSRGKNDGQFIGIGERISKRFGRVIMICCIVLGVITSVLSYISSISAVSETINNTSDVAANYVSSALQEFVAIAYETGSIARLADPEKTTEEKKAILDQRIKDHDFDGGYLIDSSGVDVITGQNLSDRVYFTEKPFIVLEFSKKKEGPYKDADPFPYDMSELDFEQEIMFSLGIK